MDIWRIAPAIIVEESGKLITVSKPNGSRRKNLSIIWSFFGLGAVIFIKGFYDNSLSTILLSMLLFIFPGIVVMLRLSLDSSLLITDNAQSFKLTREYLSPSFTRGKKQEKVFKDSDISYVRQSQMESPTGITDFFHIGVGEKLEVELDFLNDHEAFEKIKELIGDISLLVTPSNLGDRDRVKGQSDVVGYIEILNGFFLGLFSSQLIVLAQILTNINLFPLFAITGLTTGLYYGYQRGQLKQISSLSLGTTITILLLLTFLFQGEDQKYFTSLQNLIVSLLLSWLLPSRIRMRVPFSENAKRNKAVSFFLLILGNVFLTGSIFLVK